MKTPKKSPKPPQVQSSTQPQKAKDGFWDVNPLEALGNLLDGTIFDGPKLDTPEVTEDAQPDIRHEEPPKAPVNVNIRLGDLFKPAKRSKLRPATASGSEEEGAPAGNEEQADK